MRDRDHRLGRQGRVARLLSIAGIGALPGLSTGGRIRFDHPIASLQRIARQKIRPVQREDAPAVGRHAKVGLPVTEFLSYALIGFLCPPVASAIASTRLS
jgi:hypothetical protein